MGALDAYAQPLDAGQRVQHTQYLNATADADTARRQQEAAAAEAEREAKVKSQMPIAGLDAQQWTQDPAYQVPFAKAPAEARSHFISAYEPGVAVHAPELWDEAVQKATGKIPGLDDMEAAGATVDEKGSVTRKYKFKSPPAADLTPEERAMKESIVNYDLPLTGRGGLPQATRQKIMGAVALENGPDSANPYNAAEYQSRQAARTLFKSGTAARNITSANTVIGHLDALNDQVDQLHNRSFTPWNAVANRAERMMGDPAVTKFNNIRDAAVTELASLFKGTGAAPTDGEIKHWRDNFDSSLSPAQLKENIKTAATDLLGSRLSALQEQWDKGVKNNRDIPFLTPKAAAILKKLGAEPTAIDPVAAPTGEVLPPAANLTPHDQKAIDWANAHPNDPYAKQIKAIHGIQ